MTPCLSVHPFAHLSADLPPELLCELLEGLHLGLARRARAGHLSAQPLILPRVPLHSCGERRLLAHPFALPRGGRLALGTELALALEESSLER